MGQVARARRRRIIKRPVDFNDDVAIFTPSMDKRAMSVFAAAPIIQSGVDGTGADKIEVTRGSQIASHWYERFDPYQGAVIAIWIPEFSTALTTGTRLLLYASSAYQFGYDYSHACYTMTVGGQTMTVNATLMAGTQEIIVFDWDSKNPYDGTNYGRFTRANVRTFGIATQPTVSAPDATMYIGSNGSDGGLCGIPQGLGIGRRPLWDGSYGFDVGNGDEIADHYNGGTGADVCLTTGAFDWLLFVPTDASPSTLVTGEGNAWGMPVADVILLDSFCQTAYAASAWADEGTPIVPMSVGFNGTDTDINCGSDASIDDLPAGANGFTAEAYVRVNQYHASDKIIRKGSGFQFELSSSGLRLDIWYDTANVLAFAYQRLTDGKQHHIAFTYNENGDRKGRIWIDGILKATSAVSVGNYNGDAAGALLLGYSTFDGAPSWGRLSNIIRYTDTFVPPSRLNPPAVDGNTKAQWNFRDGAGNVLLDETANNNDGTIANGMWNTVPDMDVDCSGQLVFFKGYCVGVDAANEGITQTIVGEAVGKSYVARVSLQYERDRRAWPYIRVRDEIAGATIVDFHGPRLSDIHTGGNNNATLVNASGHFPQALVGGKLYNITDGSSTTITAISGDMTTITGVLAGGTDDDWDTNDVYMIVPPNEDDWVWCEPFTWQAPEQRVARGQYNFTGLPLDGEPVTIRGQAYTFKNNVAGPGAGVIFVKIGATANECADNLSRAVDGDGVAGVNYSYGAGAGADANVVASVITTDVCYLEAVAVGVAGNAYGLVEAATNVAVVPTGGTLYGGVDNDCTSFSFKVLNENDEGLTYVHEAPVYENLITNPSLELGKGNPWIPDDWVNILLEVGDVQASSTGGALMHSGAEAMQFNAGAVTNEGVRASPGPSPAPGTFLGVGAWLYGAGAVGPSLVYDGYSYRASAQFALATAINLPQIVAAWGHVSGVGRVTLLNSTLQIYAAGAGSTYVDDAYAISLSPISLTCTPASLANSEEEAGVRVDGHDDAPIPIPHWRIGESHVHFRFRTYQRHAAADVAKFGFAQPVIGLLWGGATDYVKAYWSAANTICLEYNAGAAGVQSNTYDATGKVSAATAQDWQFRASGKQMAFWHGGVPIIVIDAVVKFATVPMLAYIGCDQNGSNQLDLVARRP